MNRGEGWSIRRYMMIADSHVAVLVRDGYSQGAKNP